MERAWFNEELAKAFEAWNSGKAGEVEIANLQSAIVFAYRNGIDLVLKMPRNVLDKYDNPRPMSTQDAMEFSTGREGDLMLFNIPSQKSEKELLRVRRFTLAVSDYRETGSVLIKNPVVGTFGVFHPGEMAALQPK